jgi:hypothetical protein
VKGRRFESCRGRNLLEELGFVDHDDVELIDLDRMYHGD